MNNDDAVDKDNSRNTPARAGCDALAFPARISGRSEPVGDRVRRIRHLVRKAFIQIVRNRQNFSMLFIAPLFQLFLFGYACRLDVQEVRIVVADLDGSALSSEVTKAFSRSGYFTIVASPGSYEEVHDYMQRGNASMALLIPPDLERRIQGGATAEVGVLIDGVDTVTAETVSGYAQSILKRFALDITSERINKMQGLLYETSTPRLVVPEVRDTSRAWFNPNLASKNFFVPGVVVLIMLSFSIILTSAVIVNEKEIGTIEQLMVAPISRLELILGATIPCFIIEVITLTIIVPLGLLVFDIPFRGSVSFFCFTAILFLITASAIGMTISTFCQTQQQAVLTSFMVLQPSVLLSGYAFPIENMPAVIQYITYLNPLRYFMIIVRGVFLKGTGWAVLWPQVVPLVLMGIFFIGLASMLFKRRID